MFGQKTPKIGLYSLEMAFFTDFWTPYTEHVFSNTKTLIFAENHQK